MKVSTPKKMGGGKGGPGLKMKGDVTGKGLTGRKAVGRGKK